MGRNSSDFVSWVHLPVALYWPAVGSPLLTAYLGSTEAKLGGDAVGAGVKFLIVLQ